MMQAMHEFGVDEAAMANAVIAYALDRIATTPPLDESRSPEALRQAVGETITADGLGWARALELFDTELSRACLSTDFPRSLSFVPAAPTKAAVLFDLIVGASSIFGGSWLEGAGAVYAENQALRWVADLAGMPAGAGGCFVSGGTAGNLSGLVAARHGAAARRVEAGLPERPPRWSVMASSEAHSSIASAARVMDIGQIDVEVGDDFRLTGAELRATLDGLAPEEREGVFAVVASAGTTNLGVVDDLAGIGEVCAAEGLWFHVDGAFGGGALASPKTRPLFDGIEQADSLVVDPHKWLFAPYDCAALVYRNPDLARQAHTQHAGYLEPITSRDEWNPADYAHHLSRRVRGLPFWFSLAAHGTAAYETAVTAGVELAEAAAQRIDAHPNVELVWGPNLAVVVFRRPGWTDEDYSTWSNRLRDDGTAMVVPTRLRGETVLRFCFINPVTTVDDIDLILHTID